ncbi:MAG: hypothetical protein Kow0059_02820 [Candidatus Sumerlaeia bacterium]
MLEAAASAGLAPDTRTPGAGAEEALREGEPEGTADTGGTGVSRPAGLATGAPCEGPRSRSESSTAIIHKPHKAAIIIKMVKTGFKAIAARTIVR